MKTIAVPATFTATDKAPVSIYYCKAGLKTGQTVRVAQGSAKVTCRGVALDGVSGTMIHGNSTGPAKASGARCVLRLTSGLITISDP